MALPFTSLPVPIINGHSYGFASAEIDCRGRIYHGVVSLNWKEENPKEDVYGNARVALSRTSGQYKASGDMEMLLDHAAALLADLGPGWSDVPFNIGIQYEEIPGAGTLSVELIGVMLVSAEVSNARGPAAITKKFGLSIISPIRENGLTMVPDPFNKGTNIGSAIGALASNLF